jgi:hypothetical protein
MYQYYNGKVQKPEPSFGISFTCPWNTHLDPGGPYSREYVKSDAYSLDHYFDMAVSAGLITLTAKEILNVTLTGSMITDGIDDVNKGSGQATSYFVANFPKQPFLYQNNTFASGYPNIGGNTPPSVYNQQTLAIQEVSTILSTGDTILLSASMVVDNGGWNVIKFQGGWTISLGPAYAPPSSMRLDLKLSCNQRAYYENGTGVPVAVVPPEPQVWRAPFIANGSSTAADRSTSLLISWVSATGNNNGSVKGAYGSISSDGLTLTVLIPGLPPDTYDFVFSSSAGFAAGSYASSNDNWALTWTIGGSFANKVYNAGDTYAFTLIYQEATRRVYIAG